MLQSLILAKGDSNLRSDTVLEPGDPQALSSPCPGVAEKTWHFLRAYHVTNTYSSLPPPSFILSPLLDLVLAARPNLSVSGTCQPWSASGPLPIPLPWPKNVHGQPAAENGTLPSALSSCHPLQRHYSHHSIQNSFFLPISVTPHFTFSSAITTI